MDNNKGYKRQNQFIDKGFQTNFILKFSSVVFFGSIIIGALVLFFSRGMTTVVFENTNVVVKSSVDLLWPIILQTIIIVNIFTAIAVVIMLLYTSHKISGPLYSITRQAKMLKHGDLTVTFRIRHNDQLKELAQELFDTTSQLRKEHSQMRLIISDVKQMIDDKDAPEDVLNKMHALDALLDRFKV